MPEVANSGLTHRGLVLLGLMAAVVVVLWAVLRPSRQTPPEAAGKPDLPAALVCPIVGTFPASVPWSSVGRMDGVMPSAPGWQVRYNATVALARRGSPRLPFDILSEMLDEDRQMRNWRARLQDGREVPDEAAARRTVLAALKVFAEWHKHADAVKTVGADNPDLRKVYAAVEKLTHSPNQVVKMEATNVRLNLPKG
ncbi:MAG TPA: hypothetical protein VEL76_14850 [Gemmataceae bacterium]|nr:hypothetical protein [Gemmataceae bacterium]